MASSIIFTLGVALSSLVCGLLSHGMPSYNTYGINQYGAGYQGNYYNNYGNEVITADQASVRGIAVRPPSYHFYPEYYHDK